jgi:hypothetical protein
MIYVTRIYHRKDTNTDWYAPSREYSEHLKENYLDTKKVTMVVQEESADGLSLITLSVFSDTESKDLFQSDAVCVEHMKSRENYYSTNLIVSENTVVIEK